MSIKILLIIGLSFLMNSCSLFINQIDDDLLNEQTISYKKATKTKNYCEKTKSFSLVSENEKNQESFKSFLAELKTKYKLTFADEIALWSLLQMNIRPDLSSPSSKLQFFIKQNKRTNFFHIFTKNKQKGYPYLHGISLILKKYRSNYNLLQLAQLFDSSYKKRIFVTESFESFLKTKKDKLKAMSSLKRHYIRGDETLKKNETISKQKLSPLVKEYYKQLRNTEYSVSNYLFNYKRNNLINAQCNYDMGLYSSSIYLIHKDIIQSNSFGLKKGNSAFMADSTQEIKEITTLGKTLYFKGTSQTRSTAMCQFNLPLKEQWELWLISTQSRDPGQHLFHLMEYGLHDMQKLSQIDGLLKFSRHLFLKNPIRLILESERSNPEQLNELLKLNMPIYNANKLAKIWGYYSNNNKKSFVVDERRPGSLTCQ
jgi:hypothetical protein